MYNNNGNGSGAAWARRFIALFAIMLALGLMASSGEAAPFAYVADGGDGTVTVIETAKNPPSVVATWALPRGLFGFGPDGIAVSPDGTHVYATLVDIETGGTVAVIDTVTNTLAEVFVGQGFPSEVAVSPDGKYAYVTIGPSINTVLVMDTATCGGHDPGGVCPQWGRRRTGWETRLCHE